MDKTKFINKNLEGLLGDKEVAGEFRKAGSDKERGYLRDKLEYFLGEEYDTRFEGYEMEDSGWLKRFGLKHAPKGLRAAGLVAGLAGSGLAAYIIGQAAVLSAPIIPAIFAAVPSYFFYKKLFALPASVAADAIEETRYATQAGGGVGEKVKTSAKAGTESLFNKALAYAVPFGEVLDYFRGKRKWTDRMAKNAAYGAKNNFLKYARGEVKFASLDRFKDPDYADVSPKQPPTELQPSPEQPAIAP